MRVQCLHQPTRANDMPPKHSPTIFCACVTMCVEISKICVYLCHGCRTDVRVQTDIFAFFHVFLISKSLRTYSMGAELRIYILTCKVTCCEALLLGAWLCRSSIQRMQVHICVCMFFFLVCIHIEKGNLWEKLVLVECTASTAAVQIHAICT